MKVRESRQYVLNWTMGSPAKKYLMISELAEVAEFTNTPSFVLLPMKVRVAVVTHLLNASPQWAYAVYTGVVNITINADFSYSLGVYGAQIGCISLPIVKGITSRTEVEYVDGNEIYHTNFDIDTI
jgi:hypothetical protein